MLREGGPLPTQEIVAHLKSESGVGGIELGHREVERVGVRSGEDHSLERGVLLPKLKRSCYRLRVLAAQDAAINRTNRLRLMFQSFH